MTTYTVPVQTRDNTEKNDNTEFKLILDLRSNCGSAQLVDDTASVIICDTRSEYAVNIVILILMCVITCYPCAIAVAVASTSSV